MARIRSPNYPQIGLGPAIERVRSIYKSERQNRIDRDTAVKLMGFGGYNGASAGVLSALIKFGLLEQGANKELKVSDLAVRILVPHDEREKAEAVMEAARTPSLFVELAERWPDDPPSDHSLRSYLTRRGFAESALESVIKSYWDTAGLAKEAAPQSTGNNADIDDGDDFDSLLTGTPEKRGSGTPAAVPPPPPPPPPSSGPGLNLMRTESGYIVQLSGAVLNKGHVDEVVTLLTALKASMPDASADTSKTTDG